MIRLQRKNYLEKIPDNAVLVARPSRWGNPYKLSDYKLKDSLYLYEIWLDKKLKENSNFLNPLKGKNLVCYCKLHYSCHADIIIKKCK